MEEVYDPVRCLSNHISGDIDIASDIALNIDPVHSTEKRKRDSVSYTWPGRRMVFG